MALPVIAGVYRQTILWGGSHGIVPRNVLNYHSASGDVLAVGASIAAAFESVGASTNLWNPCSDGQTATSFSLLPLDGVTASVDRPFTHAQAGQTATGGDFIPEACYVLSLKTGFRGPQGRGRVYIGPIGEQTQANGLVDATRATNVLTAWGTLITARAAQTPAVTLVVASYKHAVAHNVTSLRVDTVIGTQRRRLNQLR